MVVTPARMARIRALLSHPRVLVIAAVAGLVVYAQGLFLGYQVDDLWHHIFLVRPERWSHVGIPSPLWLFHFYDGDRERTHWLIDQGVAPWWTDPALRLMFLRPLTSATHVLDHLIAPGSAALAHAHSLLWYAALVATVGALYRRALGATWVAGLAAMFYAVDYNHGVVATWIANRSALVSGTLGIAAVLAHARGRDEGSRLWHALSAALLAGSLFGGEVGVSACAWLGAWALTMDTGRLRTRLAALAPQVVVTIGWAAVYQAGRFGAHGSGIYVDPVRAPIAYAAGLFEKIPLMVAADLGAPGPDAVTFGERGPQIALLVLSVALSAAAILAVAPLVRTDRAARFFALGTVLSFLPACATFASVRQLTLPGIGILGLVAQLVAAVADGDPRVPIAGIQRRVMVGFAGFSVLAHAVFSPITAQMSARQLWVVERWLHRWSDPIDDTGLTQARLVIVNAPLPLFVGYIMPRRWADGRAVPRSLLTMGLGTRDMDLTRPDAGTLIARQEQGYALADLELLTTSRAHRWSVGDHVDLDGVRIEVLDTTPDARPLRVAFRFAAPLEDASLRWVTWDGEGLVPFALPAVGGSMTIRARVLSPF